MSEIDKEEVIEVTNSVTHEAEPDAAIFDLDSLMQQEKEEDINLTTNIEVAVKEVKIDTSEFSIINPNGSVNLDVKPELEELTKEEQEVTEELESILPPVKNAKITEDIINRSGEQDPTIIDYLNQDSDLKGASFLANKRPMEIVRELSNYIKDLEKKANDIELPTEEQIEAEEEIDEIALLVSGIMQSSDTTGLEDTMFANKEADIQQGLRLTNGQLLSMGKLETSTNAKELSGKAAIIKATEAMGLGELVNVQLPHSGFWVTLLPPSDRDLIGFYNTFARDKTNIGRNTLGLTFGNMSVKTNRDLFNFIKRHVYSTTIKDVEKTDLDDKVMLNDLPILAWGFARSIYPHGFPYHRKCTNVGERDALGNYPDACTHVEQEYINLDKLYVLDNSRLNDTQKSILSATGVTTITLEQQQDYVKQFNHLNKNMFVYKNVEIHLAHPTLQTHFDDGIEWLESVLKEHEYTIATTKLTDDEKEENINIELESTILKNWVHYVDHILVNGKRISQRKDIREIIGRYGVNREFHKLFVKSVIEFRNKSVVATIGIPEYTCPKCHALNEVKDPDKLTNVIPLDPINLFFLMFSIRFQMAITQM